MRKITFCALFACAVCFASCGGKNTDENPNYSTSTEKIGSGEGDELTTESADNANTGMNNTSDSTQIQTGAAPAEQ